MSEIQVGDRVRFEYLEEDGVESLEGTVVSIEDDWLIVFFPGVEKGPYRIAPLAAVCEM